MAVTRAPAAAASCTAAMPTPPAAPWMQTRSPSAEAALREEGVVGGGERLGEAARLVPGHPVGHGQQVPLVDDGLLGLPTTADHRHDAVADGEPGGAGTEAPHLAGELEAGDVGGGAGRRRVETGHLEAVGAVEPSGAHVDEHLAAPRDRVGVLLPREGAVDDGDGVHQGPGRRQPRWSRAT